MSRFGLGTAQRQLCLIFGEDRTVRQVWLPVRAGCLVDDKGQQAWDVEPHMVYPLLRNRRQAETVVLLHEANAIPFDLGQPDLAADGMADEKLKQLGEEAITNTVMQLATRRQRNPLQMAMWIALLFAVAIVLLAILQLWHAGVIKIPQGVG